MVKTKFRLKVITNKRPSIYYNNLEQTPTRSLVQSPRYIDRVDIQVTIITFYKYFKVLLFAMFPLLGVIFAVVWPIIRIFPDNDSDVYLVNEVAKEVKVE